MKLIAYLGIEQDMAEGVAAGAGAAGPLVGWFWGVVVGGVLLSVLWAVVLGLRDGARLAKRRPPL